MADVPSLDNETVVYFVPILFQGHEPATSSEPLTLPGSVMENPSHLL